MSQTIRSLPAFSVTSYGLLPNRSLEQDLETLCFLLNWLVSKKGAVAGPRARLVGIFGSWCGRRQDPAVMVIGMV